MRPRYDFGVVLSSDPTDEQADAVFEAFDGDPPTLTVSAGTPRALFHVTAASWDDAFRVAASGLRRAGLSVERFEVEPDAVAA